MTRDLDTEGPVPGQTRIDVGALRHMSLCTGYGGIDIALERAFGAETVAVSDIDPGACKILAHRYPHVPNIGDMTTVDWREWVGKVDIISGGTPCQDLSSAGRRRGMTEGTRSNLWVAMRDAIATIKPALVVWENVRGAFSATADSDLEPCAGCVGERTGEPVLRALGRVLGDLSDLGYDAWWYGLRASDVGAAHHRFRVFVFAVRADADERGREREWWLRAIRRHAHRPDRANELRCAGESAARVSLPSPRTSDTNGPGHHGTGGPDLRTVVSIMPTPRAMDGTKGGPNQRGSSGDVMLPSVAAHLPTPTASLGEHRRDSGVNPERRRAQGRTVSTADIVCHSLDAAQFAAAQDWREYEPAIRRQEAAFGHPAPLPTEPNKNGNPRLSAEFSSWLMGLEPGWITDTPGITRNEALKAAGNGVVPQQCEAAARRFLSDYSSAMNASSADTTTDVTDVPSALAFSTAARHTSSGTRTDRGMVPRLTASPGSRERADGEGVVGGCEEERCALVEGAVDVDDDAPSESGRLAGADDGSRDAVDGDRVACGERCCGLHGDSSCRCVSTPYTGVDTHASEPCNLGPCAAPRGHDGTCLEASGWAT